MSGSDRTRFCFGVLVAGLFGCGGGDDANGPPPGPVSRGIQIVSGANITDSVGTVLGPPLIVSVRDSSGALPPLATPVRFEAVGPCVDDPYGLSCTNPWGRVAMGQTDNEGRAVVFVRLGIRPGPGGIAVSVPSLGLRDTARYVAAIGGPDRIILTPTDTAITIGGSYPLHGETRDRYGNKRSDAFAWTVVETGATVSSLGVVTGTAMGRYRVAASAGGLRDTVMFTAVPPGTLLAFDWLQGEVVTLALDGTNRKVWARAIDTGIGVRPRLLPGGGRVVYSDYNGVIQELRVADGTGSSTPFLSPLPPTMGTHGDVAPDLQGSWVYFGAYDTRCPVQSYCLFRARIDGSSVEFLGDVANPTNASFRPTASPDGRYVAYTTVLGTDPIIRIMNADTRTLLPAIIYGTFPQWSPTGGRIVFIKGFAGLSIVNADGTGERVLVPDSANFSEGAFGWSPDERWIVRFTELAFELVDATTGKILRLPHLDALREPSWP